MSVYLIFVVIPPSEERPDDLVDASYVARRFGCSTSSVYAGKCGTGGIRPVSRDPWRALREQVAAEHARLVSGARGRQAEGLKKRMSLVRRAK